jgi:ribosomal protein L7Ae-like RNA K-turn-binding protein
MKEKLTADIREVMDAVHYRPAVSVILPFDPKISLVASVQKDLKYALDKVEKQLKEQYPAEQTAAVMQRIAALTADMVIPTNKKGLALFASPVFSKLMFLDAEVSARIVIDESFEIRDLVFSRKEEMQYILFLLSSEHCKMYLGSPEGLLRVKLESPDSLDAYWIDAAERVSNFSDPDAHKANQVEKFIRQMDKELSQMLKQNRVPVFIMGSKTILGLFKTITHNQTAIAGYTEGNFDGATEAQLLQAIQPVVQAWKRKRQQELLQQIEQAANEKKLAVGIQDVWQAAYEKNGRLLVVEKGYTAAGEHIADGKIVYKPTAASNAFHLAHDVVDDVIEMVLQNGGDVAFTDDGLLQQYQHIVLLKFYA